MAGAIPTTTQPFDTSLVACSEIYYALPAIYYFITVAGCCIISNRLLRSSASCSTSGKSRADGNLSDEMSLE